MATYEYYCKQCGTSQEISHPMSDAPTIICVDCTLPRIKKPGVAGTIFKGGGWGKN